MSPIYLVSARNLFGLINTSQTHMTENTSFIITGDSSIGLPGTITVWKNRTDSGSNSLIGSGVLFSTLGNIVSRFQRAAWWLVLLAAVVCILQNFFLVGVLIEALHLYSPALGFDADATVDATFHTNQLCVYSYVFDEDSIHQTCG